MNIVTWYASDYHACGHVRAEVPARAVNRAAANWHVVVKADILMSDFPKSGMMVFQRAHKAEVVAKLALARQAGIRTVYELDDDLLAMPPEFQEPYRFYSKPEVRDGIIAGMNGADAVLVSTPELGEAVARYAPGKPRFLVENYLDAEGWAAAYAAEESRPARAECTIGYMASGSHTLDAPLVLPALRRVLADCPQARLHLIGWVGWKELGPEFEPFRERITAQGWVEITALPYAMADFDVGIAPLLDCPFNRAKSGIKALQYWALGAPVVASPLPCYRRLVEHRGDGFLCADEEEWYRVLKGLVEDRELRRSMGARGRLKLLREWDIERNVGRWVNTFGAMMGKGG